MHTASIKLFIICTLLIISCKKDNNHPIEPIIFQIDAEYRPFLESFLKEAKLRNITIDTTNLILTSAKQSSILKETCGTCFQNTLKTKPQKTIEINSNSAICWQTVTNNAREALVFHELGHCLLGRIHQNETFTDGSPKSIMYADNTDLYSPCVYAIDDVSLCNKTERRKYYMDELFNSKTPSPTWVK